MSFLDEQLERDSRSGFKSLVTNAGLDAIQASKRNGFSLDLTEFVVLNTQGVSEPLPFEKSRENVDGVVLHRGVLSNVRHINRHTLQFIVDIPQGAVEYDTQINEIALYVKDNRREEEGEEDVLFYISQPKNGNIPYTPDSSARLTITLNLADVSENLTAETHFGEFIDFHEEDLKAHASLFVKSDEQATNPRISHNIVSPYFLRRNYVMHSEALLNLDVRASDGGKLVLDEYPEGLYLVGGDVWVANLVHVKGVVTYSTPFTTSNTENPSYVQCDIDGLLSVKEHRITWVKFITKLGG